MSLIGMKLKDLPLRNSYLVKHYNSCELFVYQDAIDHNFGELEITYSYVHERGFKVVVVR